MRKRALIVAAVGAAVAGLGNVIANAGADSPAATAHQAAPGFDLAHSDLDLPAAQTFRDFPLYYPGSRFRDLPLTAINRRNGRPGQLAPAGVDYVSLKYGTCNPRSSTGCPAPLEVQIWPACVRNPSLYALTPDPDGGGPKIAEPYPREQLTLRGVPSAFFDAGRRLELYTGNVTLVLWGRDRQQLLEAARGLRGLTSQLLPEQPLPLPVPGARAGGMSCP